MDRTKTIALILLAVLTAMATGASTAQTLAALPTPSRPDCGPAEVRGYRAHGISGNKQRYRVTGETLTVPREDRCGTFNVLLRWTQVPLPSPTIQPGN